MPFIKGVSGNIAGKPMGALNKKTIEQIDRAGRVLELIETKFLEKDIAKLTPSQRMTLYTEMMEYKLPKLQRTALSGVDNGPITITINARNPPVMSKMCRNDKNKKWLQSLEALTGIE